MRYNHTESVHLCVPGYTGRTASRLSPVPEPPSFLRLNSLFYVTFPFWEEVQKHPDILHRLGSEDEAPCQGGLRRSHPSGSLGSGVGGRDSPLPGI